jgi:hypothetical protein
MVQSVLQWRAVIIIVVNRTVMGVSQFGKYDVISFITTTISWLFDELRCGHHSQAINVCVCVLL